MRKLFSSTIICSLVLAGVAALVPVITSAAPAPAAGEKPKGLKLFYACHSLLWDAPQFIKEMAEADGIKGTEVLGIQRIGVSQTSQHWDLADAQNEAKKALKTGNVDAFVMSPIIMPDEAITKFVKLGLEHNKNMKFYLQVSWPGLGLTDNNDFSLGGGGARRGAGPGGAGAPGGRGPGGAPGAAPGGAPAPAPAPVPGGPAGQLNIPSNNPLVALMSGLPSFAVAAPAPAAAPAAAGAPGAAPAPGAPARGVGRGGAPGAGRGGPGGGAGGMGGMMGGGGNYEKTAEELALINAKNDKAAEEQAKKINDEIGHPVVFLVPSSKAHNALRLAILKKEVPGMTMQGDLFRDSIGHPTQPMVALNAYIHYAVMYNRNPIGLPQPSVLKASVQGLGWKDGYQDEKLNKKLQEMAWELVSKYPPSGVTAK